MVHHVSVEDDILDCLALVAHMFGLDFDEKEAFSALVNTINDLRLFVSSVLENNSEVHSLWLWWGWLT